MQRLPLLFVVCGCLEPKEPGPVDDDGDGFTVAEDCNDFSRSTYPGADEVCDGADNDCDGEVDEDPVDSPTWFLDLDGDGAAGTETVVACDAPDNVGVVEGDCDDSDASIFPGAPEDCKATVDMNCDGALPQDDNDKDGFVSCEECDDFDADINPDATEVCDEVDNDCNGVVDDDADDAVGFYPDEDSDGFGVDGKKAFACAPPDGYAKTDDDCDDSNPATYPGAEEACDGLDNDCDEAVPDDELDMDEDGYDVCGDQDCNDDDPKIGPDDDLDEDGTVDCYDEDDDDDGLTDEEEEAGTSGFVTDPTDDDTDDDGVLDGDDAAPLHDFCASNLYLFDDFSTDPGGDWEAPIGIWGWDGDTYASTGSWTWATTWLPSEEFDDFVLSAHVRPDDSLSDVGVMFRVADAGETAFLGEYYYVSLNPELDIVQLDYFALGNTFVLDYDSVTVDTGTTYEIQVTVLGSDIEVSVDGVSRLSASNTNLASGSVGFRTGYSAATFDDLIVCD